MLGVEKETETAQPFSLEQAREYAVKHNATAENARLDVAMARKKIWETTATGLPQVKGSISYRNALDIPVTLVPAQIFDPDAAPDEFMELKFGTQHNATMELTVDQLIFSGSYIVALKASQTYLKISQEGRAKTEIEVKAAVTDTYYLILLAEQTKQTLDATLKNLEKTLYETQEMHKAGFLEDTDVDQLQLTATNLENSVRSMERQIRVTYRLLKFQMGLNLDAPIRLTENLDEILSALNPEKLLAEPFKLENHIDFRIARTQEKSYNLLWKRQISEYLPTISAYYTYTRMAMRDSFNFFKKNDEKWFPSSTVGVQINIPIFSSGMRAAQVAQAKLELRKARNTKKQTADNLRLELIQARSAFEDATEKKESTQKSLNLAKRIYEKTIVKYGKGMSSSLDLSQIHNQYLTAESDYMKVVVDLLNAKTRLDKVLSRI